MIKNVTIRRKQRELIKKIHLHIWGKWDGEENKFAILPAPRPRTRLGKKFRRLEFNTLAWLKHNRATYLREFVKNDLKVGEYIDEESDLNPKIIGKLVLNDPVGETYDSCPPEVYQAMKEPAVQVLNPGKVVPVYWGNYGDPNRKLIGSGFIKDDGVTFEATVDPEHADKLFDRSYVGRYSVGI